MVLSSVSAARRIQCQTWPGIVRQALLVRGSISGKCSSCKVGITVHLPSDAIQAEADEQTERESCCCLYGSLLQTPTTVALCGVGSVWVMFAFAVLVVVALYFWLHASLSLSFFLPLHPFTSPIDDEDHMNRQSSHNNNRTKACQKVSKVTGSWCFSGHRQRFTLSCSCM